MARRRLLSILAASAVFTGALAGPAAAVELIDGAEESVTDVAHEPVEVTREVVEAVVDAVDTAETEPVEEVVDAVEEAVAPEPASPSSPERTRSEVPAAAPAATAEPGEELVAAGTVAAAPDLSFLARTGDRVAVPQSRLGFPLASPAVHAVPAAPARTTVEAPQVADAPAEVAELAAPSAPSVLAQPATAAVPDEATPVLLLVAFASLLAAGSATVREARIAATS